LVFRERRRDTSAVLPEVIDALEYLACVAHCVKNNPEKLAAALAKAGWNVGKSKVEDFLGIFSVLTFIEFNEEGDPEFDQGKLTEEFIENLGKAQKQLSASRMNALCKAHDSIEDAVEQWAKTGGQNGKHARGLLDSLRNLDDKARREAIQARKAAKTVKSGLNAAKSLSNANTLKVSAELVIAAAAELAKQCKDQCDKSCDNQGGDE
jgi:hypothetical protein